MSTQEEVLAKKLVKLTIKWTLISIIVLFVVSEALPLFLKNSISGLLSAFLSDVSVAIVGISSAISITMIGFLLTAFSVIVSLSNRENMARFFKSNGYKNLVCVYKAGFIGNALLLLVHLITIYLSKLPLNIGVYIILEVFIFTAYFVYRCITAVFSIISASNKTD